MMKEYLLYLFGPSSKQNVRVSVASSSKNSVAKASHQRLSLSCNIQIHNTVTILWSVTIAGVLISDQTYWTH